VSQTTPINQTTRTRRGINIMASEVNIPPAAPQQNAPARLWPPEVAPLLGRVEQLLETEGPGQALDFLDRTRDGSAGAINARGGCLLRLGQTQRALDLFRGLALGGAALRNDVPLAFKANYATARLLTGDLTGCIVALGQIRDEGHPAVQRLREAIRRWR